MVLAPNEHLHLSPVSVARLSGHGRVKGDLAAGGERALAPYDVTEVMGLPVTTRLRTALDLGRVRNPDRAIAGMDAMVRLGGFSHEELMGSVPRFAGHRWVRTLREIAPLADGRAESPPESVLRLRCLGENAPRIPIAGERDPRAQAIRDAAVLLHRCESATPAGQHGLHEPVVEERRDLGARYPEVGPDGRRHRGATRAEAEGVDPLLNAALRDGRRDAWKDSAELPPDVVARIRQPRVHVVAYGCCSAEHPIVSIMSSECDVTLRDVARIACMVLVLCLCNTFMIKKAWAYHVRLSDMSTVHAWRNIAWYRTCSPNRTRWP